MVVMGTTASQDARSDFMNSLLQMNPEIKIILSSDHDLDSLAQDLLDAGAHGFVLKPFRAEVLAPKIRSMRIYVVRAGRSLHGLHYLSSLYYALSHAIVY